MIILLDIDGVLITTPAWRAVEQHEAGFLKFNERATQQLIRLLNETDASIVLTSTHRITYTVDEWNNIFRSRGIIPSSISKINEASSIVETTGRAAEIAEWVARQNTGTNYVIIDDDLSINGLPESIKLRCVLTKPLIGLDVEAANRTREILQRNSGA